MIGKKANKKNSSKTFFLILILMFLGCDNTTLNENFEELETLTIEPDLAETIDINDITVDLTYLELKTPNELFFTGIQKLIFDGDSIFLLDRSQSKSRVICFDQDGNFKYVIDRQGRGPGEYEFINDIDTNNSSLILSTQVGLNFYNKKNGTYTKTISNSEDQSYQVFKILDNFNIVTENGRYRSNLSKQQIKIYDIDDLKLLHEDVPFTDFALKGGDSHRYFFEYNDTLSAQPMYSDILYRITKKDSLFTIEPAYKFDFGDSWIPNELLENSYENIDRFFEEVGNYVHTLDIYETNEVIYVDYKLKSKRLTFIYDKDLGIGLNVSNFTNNAIGWFRTPLTTHNNKIVNVVQSSDFDQNYISPSDELRKIFTKGSEGDIAVIIFADFNLSEYENQGS